MRETNSWYDIEANKKVDVNVNVEETDNTIIRVKKIRLYPNRQQRLQLKRDMIGFRRIYNWTAMQINQMRTWKIRIPHEHIFRAQMTDELPKEITSYFDKYKCNSELVASAILDAHKAYVSAQANLVAGNIRQFKLGFKKNENMSLLLTKNNFSEVRNGFCTSVYGEMKSEESIIGIKKSCRVINHGGKYTLYLPIEVPIKSVTGRVNLVALDPGGKTFQTMCDVNDQVTKVCNGSKEMFMKHHDELLHVHKETGNLWSPSKNNYVKKLKISELYGNISASDLERLNNLKANYPVECERIIIAPLNTENSDSIKTKKPKKPKKRRRKTREFVNKNKHKHRRRRCNKSTRLGPAFKKTRSEAYSDVLDQLSELQNVENKRIEKLKVKNVSIQKHNDSITVGSRKKRKTPHSTLPSEEFLTNHSLLLDKLKLLELGNGSQPHDKKNSVRTLEAKMKKKNKRIRDKMLHKTYDLHCKVAINLVKKYDNIAIGNMSTKSIISRTGKLSSDVKKHFANLSHYSFRQRLIAKAEEYSCNIYVIDEFRTSKTCYKCSHIHPNLGTADEYICVSQECKFRIDRDTNGAKNIMKVHLGTFKQTRAHAAQQRETAKLLAAEKKSLAAQLRIAAKNLATLYQ